MIQIPVIDDVLVVPDDLAGVGIQGERAVVIEVLLVVAAEDELGRGNRDGRADVDQVQLRIVARHHPGSDVPPLFHRHIAPRFEVRLARSGNGVEAPHLLPGSGVVRGDDARVAAGVGLALAAGDDLAVGDDRSAGRRGTFPGLENRRFPHQLPGLRVQRVDVVVRARIDDQVAPDRKGPGPLRVHAFRQLAFVLPQSVAGLRVGREDVVACARHIHDAVVDERCSFGLPGTQWAGPDHP